MLLRHESARHWLRLLPQSESIFILSISSTAFSTDTAGRVNTITVDRHPGLRLCSTIEEALILGTGSLAVDGVVVVGEHGNYPKNEYGTTMHPHYRFFEEIMAVFRKSGRSVPYFSLECCKPAALLHPLQGV